MNSKKGLVSILFFAALLFVTTPAMAYGTGEGMTQAHFYLGKAMVGAEVYSDQGQLLGHVDQVVRGDDGRITYVILAQNAIRWSDLTAQYSTPAWIDTGIRLIPIPYSEVYGASISGVETSARELAEGKPYWGSVAPAFRGIPTDQGYYVRTPANDAFTQGEVYWGSLPAGSISPDVGIQRTFVNHHISVNVSEAKLAKAPSFSPDDWAKFASSQFKQTVNAYFEEGHVGE